MPWQQRLREAAYTSPNGTRLTFDFEDVRREVDKKTTGFTFPDADGTFVQQNGRSGRRLPLRIFFWGDDYDLEAAAFDAALLENGVGRLEHPAYGQLDVVPFGTITQRDDLKTAANQAVFELTFWETINLVFPASLADPASEVLSAVSAYNTAAAEDFEGLTTLTSAVQTATFRNEYLALVGAAESGLQAIANEQDDVRQQFDAIVDSVTQGINVLVRDPLTLAFQTSLLIQAPARALSSIQARLDAYGNLATSIISGEDAIAESSADVRVSNAFHTDDLFASGYVTGSIVSVVNTSFQTKTAALSAAEVILTQFNNVQAWREANFSALLEIDTGGSYQRLQEAVALAAGLLVEISFSLKQERRFTLQHPRTMIDLTAELYGEVDAQLDFFIDSNDLSGSEMIEIPRGREIVFYI